MWSGYIGEIIKWFLGNEIYFRKFVLFIVKLLVKMINKKVFFFEISVN